MVLLTLIARTSDGLPLAASVQDDEELGKNLVQYQSQAKQIFKRLSPSSPNRCTIDSGAYFFHYIIVNDVCYLVLTEKSFPKRAAFSYLEDLQNEFDMQYGNRVSTVGRPYAFIEFDRTNWKYAAGHPKRPDLRSVQTGPVHPLTLYADDCVLAQRIESLNARIQQLRDASVPTALADGLRVREVRVEIVADTLLPLTEMGCGPCSMR